MTGRKTASDVAGAALRGKMLTNGMGAGAELVGRLGTMTGRKTVNGVADVVLNGRTLTNGTGAGARAVGKPEIRTTTG